MPNDPQKEDYRFDGWFWDEGVWEKPFTANSLHNAPLSNNMSVYAKWEHDHKFDNDCDTKCDECGFTRVTTHVYSFYCDSNCNICGFVREAYHLWDNACDTACNYECGEVRIVEHVYDNACDKKCNVCKEVRFTAHVYDHACDNDCNECGYTYNDNYKESKGHQIYVPTVIKEEIDLNYSVINDSSYPFRTQNGILVSTNHSDDTVSTYTIIALKDFFFEAECRASSETNDHLIIKLNDEILFSKGGELEWLEANIEMKAGDTLTFIYNKDGAQCEGSDCIYLALFAYNWQYVTATEEMLAEYMTCFEDLKCEHCGEVLKERTGHIYVDTVTPPTATEKGYTTHTCACGDSYTDTYNATKDLQKRFSEYYNLDTFKGIEVYVWQTNDGTYECGAMNGTNRNKTFEEILLLEKNGATFEEMRTILSSYNIDKEQIVIIPVNINAEDFEIEIGEFAQISEMFWDN